MSIPLLIPPNVERNAHSERGASGERGVDWHACRRAHGAPSGAPDSTRRPAWASQARPIARRRGRPGTDRRETAEAQRAQRAQRAEDTKSFWLLCALYSSIPGQLLPVRGSSFALHPGFARESGGTHPAPVFWKLRLRATRRTPGPPPLRAVAPLRARFRAGSAHAARVPAGLRCSSAFAQPSREAVGALPLSRNPPGKRRGASPRRRSARAPVAALFRRRGPRISAQRRRRCGLLGALLFFLCPSRRAFIQEKGLCQRWT